MKLLNTALEGVYILEPRVFDDARGYFFESFSQRDFDALLLPVLGRSVGFVQDNESASVYGVVRGLHFQKQPFAQAKLVRCVSGRVLDVAVDIRRDSPTFGQWTSVELTGENHRMCFIDKGFAHGFAVLSERAVFQYKCDEYYHPEAEGGIALDDPALAIDWQLPQAEMILSAKDQKHPRLNDLEANF